MGRLPIGFNRDTPKQLPTWGGSYRVSIFEMCVLWDMWSIESLAATEEAT